MIADGYRVHYAAVRTHLAIGTTLAEAAGLHLSGSFRWTEILERAVTRTVTDSAMGQAEEKSPD